MSNQRDIFICHASEDKPSIVEPLVKVFDAAGISYWYDRAEIKWGDSLPEKVNEGLRISKYVIVVLSQAFLDKNWPQRELNSALNIEASSGKVRVLPLLAGTEEVKKRIIDTYPIINDKFRLTWNNDPQVVVNALNSRLGKPVATIDHESAPIPEPAIDVPLPEIKKKFTQRDKDLFLKDSFGKIRSYFQAALSQLERQHSDIETDLTEIHNFKFTCTIYLHGDVANRCKIWVGGPHSTDMIAYREGDSSFDNDNSYNDWLDVSDKGFELGLKPAGFGVGGPVVEKDEVMSAEKGAEYLWLRFTERLKY